MRSLVIVQPYVPHYRRDFFDRLSTKLAGVGIDMTVAAPQASGRQAERGDSVRAAPWLTHMRGREWATPFATIVRYGSLRLGRPSAIIVPAMGTCVDTHVALAKRSLPRRGRLKVGVWGHVAAFVRPPSRLDAAIERVQLRASDHVFAYTESGAQKARQSGVRPDRITVVQNSIDTAAIVEGKNRLSANDVETFRRELGLHSLCRCVAYIGGLDSSKRIDTLAAILDQLWRIDPQVQCIVAGSGEDAHLLSEAVQRGQVVRLPYANSRDKALVAKIASCILNPGRIGLIAVDALAMGIPLVTMPYAFHAPEREYLDEEVSMFTGPSDPREFAAYVAALIPTLKPSADWWFPTLEEMVQRFVDGTERMLRAS
jgi:glycosyltransferase involved in cell wall biosynthesis